MPTVNEYGCGIHDLTYHAIRPGCPACALQQLLDKVREERDELQGQVAEMTGHLNKAQSAVNLGKAMANAIDLLDARDRTFLKTVLYRWRDRKDVDLSVTEDRRNFLTSEEMHACSSIGGAGIAGFYADAVHAYGRAAAIGMLQKAMGKELTGGVGHAPD